MVRMKILTNCFQTDYNFTWNLSFKGSESNDYIYDDNNIMVIFMVNISLRLVGNTESTYLNVFVQRRDWYTLSKATSYLISKLAVEFLKGGGNWAIRVRRNIVTSAGNWIFLIANYCATIPYYYIPLPSTNNPTSAMVGRVRFLSGCFRLIEIDLTLAQADPILTVHYLQWTINPRIPYRVTEPVFMEMQIIPHYIPGPRTSKNYRITLQERITVAVMNMTCNNSPER